MIKLQHYELPRKGGTKIQSDNQSSDSKEETSILIQSDCREQRNLLLKQIKRLKQKLNSRSCQRQNQSIQNNNQFQKIKLRQRLGPKQAIKSDKVEKAQYYQLKLNHPSFINKNQSIGTEKLHYVLEWECRKWLNFLQNSNRYRMQYQKKQRSSLKREIVRQFQILYKIELFYQRVNREEGEDSQELKKYILILNFQSNMQSDLIYYLFIVIPQGQLWQQVFIQQFQLLIFKDLSLSINTYKLLEIITQQRELSFIQ